MCSLMAVRAPAASYMPTGVAHRHGPFLAVHPFLCLTSSCCSACVRAASPPPPPPLPLPPPALSKRPLASLIGRCWIGRPAGRRPRRSGRIRAPGARPRDLEGPCYGQMTGEIGTVYHTLYRTVYLTWSYRAPWTVGTLTPAPPRRRWAVGLGAAQASQRAPNGLLGREPYPDARLTGLGTSAIGVGQGAQARLCGRGWVLAPAPCMPRGARLAGGPLGTNK
jgi:hypothetical protein